MLQAVNLTCERGERLLFSQLQLTLEPQQLLYVEGANGAGKSTLLRAVAGLFAPSSGHIEWQGRPIADAPEEYHRELLYLGHRAGIKEELTAEENLRFAVVMGGGELSREGAWQALGAMGLAGYEDQPVRAMSFGQRRRVALARLRVSRARLWLLDEPLNGLDKRSVADLLEMIHAHLQQGGMALVTTHQEVEWSDVAVKRLLLGGKHG